MTTPSTTAAHRMQRHSDPSAWSACKAAVDHEDETIEFFLANVVAPSLRGRWFPRSGRRTTCRVAPGSLRGWRSQDCGGSNPPFRTTHSKGLSAILTEGFQRLGNLCVKSGVKSPQVPQRFPGETWGLQPGARLRRSIAPLSPGVGASSPSPRHAWCSAS
jgi:hypothetical protein